MPNSLPAAVIENFQFAPLVSTGMTGLPLADERINRDTHYRLMLCRPWRELGNAYQAVLGHVHDWQITVNRRDVASLTFQTFKGAPNQDMLHRDASNETGSEEYSIAVQVWDWRVQRWIEPDNCRFVVSTWETDDADASNLIRYTCRQEVTQLDWIRAHRPTGDWRLNQDYDRALEAYQDAEREYDSLIRQLTTAGQTVQEELFGHTRGRLYAGYRGVDWVVRSWGELPWGTLYVCHLRKRIMIRYPQAREWRMLREDLGETSTQRQRMIDLGDEIRPARQRMNRTRDAYARAERAARETARDGIRFFYNRTPARLLATLWTEGGKRDTERRWAPGSGEVRPRQAKGFWRDWTNTSDGKGRSWARSTTQKPWEIPLGQGFLETVMDFQERGEIDWVARGRAFSLVPHGDLEVDQTRRVVLRVNESVTEAIERGDRNQHHSVSLVLAGNGYSYLTTWGPNVSTSATPWGWAEGTISESEADSQASASRLTAPIREERHFREIRETVRRMVVSPASPLPLVDFMPHHWVSVWDADGAQSSRIVDQIIVSKSGHDDPIQASIVMGTRRQRAFQQFYRTQRKQLGGLDHVQGHMPVDPSRHPPQIPEPAKYSPPLSLGEPFLTANNDMRIFQVAIPFSWADPGRPEPQDAGVGEDTSNDLIHPEDD